MIHDNYFFIIELAIATLKICLLNDATIKIELNNQGKSWGSIYSDCFY